MTLPEGFARWRCGELTRDELLARHPRGDTSDMAAILDLHERLTAIGAEPVPYHDSEWERLRGALPDRIARKRSRVSHLVARPLVAASMVVGLSGVAAVASPAVREQVITTWRRIEHVMGKGGDHPAAPLTPGASPTDHPTPSETPGPAVGNDRPAGGTTADPGGNSSEDGDAGASNGGQDGAGGSGSNPGGGSEDNAGGSAGGNGGGDSGGGQTPPVHVPSTGGGQTPPVHVPSTGGGQTPPVDVPSTGGGQTPPVVPSTGGGQTPPVDVPSTGGGQTPPVHVPSTGTGSGSESSPNPNPDPMRTPGTTTPRTS